MSNQDYKGNPLFSDQYSKMQHGAASPSLQYRWDIQSGAWLPDTNEDKLDAILKVFSGQLSGIHIEAKLDHDTVSHAYLSSISGSATGTLFSVDKTSSLMESNTALAAESLTKQGEANTWLSGISGELSDIEVHVSTDADTVAHEYLGSISGSATGSLHLINETHKLLEGNIGPKLESIKSTSYEIRETLEQIEDHADITEDHTNQSNVLAQKSNIWLSGISGELADIEIHVSTDADTKTHEHLQSISGTLTGSLFEQEETNEKLEQLNSTASNQYSKLSDIKDQTLWSASLQGSLLDEAKRSNVQLSGISGELADIEVHVSTDADTKSHGLLENISGTLTGSLEQEKQINQNLTQLKGKTADVETSIGFLTEESEHITVASRESNIWLSGISGELADIEVHVSTDADTTAHGLLQGILGGVPSIESVADTNERIDNKLKEANALLSGISGQQDDYLKSVPGSLTNSLAEQEETNIWLKGISGELADIEVHVATDADTKSHELLESISGTLTGQQSETNMWLKGISGELADIEVGVTVDSDETAHELLRSISGDSLLARKDLDKIIPILTGKLITSDARAHQALTNISGLAEVNNALSRLQFTKRTDTFTEKVEADHILLEAPDSEVYGSDPAPEYGVNRDILDDLFNTQYKNGRDNPNTPEAGQFFMLDESAPDNRPKQRKYAFDTEAQYALKLDSFLGNQDGAQRLSDQGLENIQNVTILNDSIYPIKIYSRETNYKSFYLYDGHSVSIDNTNASDIMVKRDHLISDFNVDYTITYLDPNAEINLERVVGAFDPPEPPPETRWTTWAPQAPLAPEPPVATENPEVQGWMASETPIVKDKEVTRTNTSALVKGKVYGAKPAMIVVVWGETEEGTSDHEEWDDFADLGQKSNEEFERSVTGLDKDLTYYFRIKATNTDGEETWSEPIEKAGLIQIEDATNITANSATISGTIRDTGGEPPTVTAYWGTANGFGIIEGLDLWQNQRVIGVTDPGLFFLIANVPNKNTTYYFGFKTVNPDGTVRSSVKSFTTLSG